MAVLGQVGPFLSRQGGGLHRGSRAGKSDGSEGGSGEGDRAAWRSVVPYAVRVCLAL